jgi:hypothetical protein
MTVSVFIKWSASNNYKDSVNSQIYYENVNLDHVCSKYLSTEKF